MYKFERKILAGYMVKFLSSKFAHNINIFIGFCKVRHVAFAPWKHWALHWNNNNCGKKIAKFEFFYNFDQNYFFMCVFCCTLFKNLDHLSGNAFLIVSTGTINSKVR